jgi:hypothetical protein
MSDGWYTERCGSYTRGPAHTFPVFRRSSIMSPSALGDSQLWFLRSCLRSSDSGEELVSQSDSRVIAESYLRGEISAMSVRIRQATANCRGRQHSFASPNSRLQTVCV